MYNFFQTKFSYTYKVNTAKAIEYYFLFMGNPITFSRPHKPQPLHKETYTEAEITKFIYHGRNLREKTAAAIASYSGVRPQELTNLRRKNFLLSQNSLLIENGKGNKDRVVEITPECSRLILDYLEQYPRNDEEFMFTTLREKHQMKRQDFAKMFGLMAKRAGITKRFHIYILRHSMTVNLFLRGIDIISLQKQLGHAWLETTFHYLRSFILMERNQYQKFSPSYL